MVNIKIKAGYCRDYSTHITFCHLTGKKAGFQILVRLTKLKKKHEAGRLNS